MPELLILLLFRGIIGAFRDGNRREFYHKPVISDRIFK
jgi:hypothetical protein